MPPADLFLKPAFKVVHLIAGGLFLELNSYP